MKCKECFYWEETSNHSIIADWTVGWCHRFPPPTTDEDTENDEFVVVTSENWCGEFKEKEYKSASICTLPVDGCVINSLRGGRACFMMRDVRIETISQLAGLTDKQISQYCHVGPKTLTKIRKYLDELKENQT